MRDICPIALPEGWGAEAEGRDVVLSASGGDNWTCFVTVSTEYRSFCLGRGSVPRQNTRAYAGRGWQAQLFEDAVQALRDVIAPAKE